MSTAAVALAVEPRKPNGRRRRAERLAVDERRNQLLELGVKIVGTRRYEEPWLEEVARSADISKGLIYHYFDTKRGFYVEILRHIAESLAQRWEDTVPPLIEQGASSHTVNSAGLNAYLDFAEAYPAAFRTLMEAGAGIDPEVKEVETYLNEQLISHIARYRGVDNLSASERAGVKGWSAFTERLMLEWMEAGSLTREKLIQMSLGVMDLLFAAQQDG